MKRALVMVVAVASLAAPSAAAGPRATRWTFDRLDRVGGLAVTVEGEPRIVKTPVGKAAEFDGVDDALFLPRHPLAGSKTFTIEALIRPDGGAFEQRWLHLVSDGGDGTPAANTRILFELRVAGDEWYLDAYARGAGYALTLIDPAKRHKVGRWYHVAQTYDGTTYRAYVDGVLQAEGPLAFTPQGPGKASVGVRINRVNHFKGAIREVRFTPRALAPRKFRGVPGGMQKKPS